MSSVKFVSVLILILLKQKTHCCAKALLNPDINGHTSPVRILQCSPLLADSFPRSSNGKYGGLRDMITRRYRLSPLQLPQCRQWEPEERR